MTRRSSRSSVSLIIIGLLSILGIAMAAATLTTFKGGGEIKRFYNPPVPGNVELNASLTNSSNVTGTNAVTAQESGLQLSMCVAPLNTTPGMALVAMGFLVIVLLIYYRYNLSLALLGGWTILPPIVLAYALLTNCGGSQIGQRPGGSGFAGPSPGDTLFAIESVPPWVMGVVLGVVLISAVALLYRTAGEDEIVIIEEDEEETELDQFAQAAGRAADRIEEHSANVDNAVYRAWLEMTDALDVERSETYSAGEFADTAIDLGMTEEDVQELTHLFNEVRYGGRDAETREEQAITVLRNIESQYGNVTDTARETSSTVRHQTNSDTPMRRNDEHDNI